MHDDQEHLIRHLLTHVECATCWHGFQFANIHVLGHENQFWLITTECTHCASQGIILALLEKTVPPAPELTPVEQARFCRRPPINPADQLALHHHLQTSDDLPSLLGD